MKKNIFHDLNIIEKIVIIFVGIFIFYLFTTQYYFLAILPAVAIMGFIFLGSQPKTGYYAILFLIPFDAFRGGAGAYQFLTITKFIGIFLLLVIAYQFLVQQKTIEKIKTNFWVTFLLFIVVSLLSTFMSNYLMYSMDHIRRLIVVYLFFLMTIVFVDEKGFKFALPVILIISITISSTISIIGYVFDVSFLTIGVEGATDAAVVGDSLKRATGASQDPNFLSVMIIFVIPFVVRYLFMMKKIFYKLLLLIILSINVLGVVLTYSRGGALVLFMMFILLAFKYMKKFRPRYLGIVFAFVALSLFVSNIITPQAYKDRLKSFNIGTDNSLDRRLSYLYVGLDALSKEPVIGSGPGTFSHLYSLSAYARFFSHGRTLEQDIFRDAHNTYIEVAVGSGVIGLILFMIMLIIADRNFKKANVFFRKQNNIEMSSLIDSYQVSLYSIAIYFCILSSLYHKYIWMCFGLSVIALKLAKKEENGYLIV